MSERPPPCISLLDTWPRGLASLVISHISTIFSFLIGLKNFDWSRERNKDGQILELDYELDAMFRHHWRNSTVHSAY